jgi:hypothetical protein
VVALQAVPLHLPGATALEDRKAEDLKKASPFFAIAAVDGRSFISR